ncbi:MAG TPA: nuclear transport factor 2 family protein [Thermoanaerobaculia bacterium]|nr:nuclear transport factor 2 family protein [Thermoanaerobaculia bacterium]
MKKNLSGRALLALVWMALAPALAGGQEAPAPMPIDPEAALRMVDARRFEAMVRRDRDALDSLLADDLTYTHSTGQVETKAQFLASIVSGGMVYKSIQPRDVQVRLYGEVAVLTGRADLQVRAQERDMDIAARFTSVYVLQDGRWRMVAWQSTRVEPPK